ncbi:MAG: ribonuclease Z, partial [Lactobacillus sp.]|nr:ribonuclease Z [Lactobacillus sp.]
RHMDAEAKKLEKQAQNFFPNTMLVNDFDQINIPMKGSEK